MEAVKDTVKNVLQSLKEKQDPNEALRSLCKKVFTRKETGHIQFSYFKKGVLHINVDSSAWLYHFSLQRDRLLTKMRKKINQIKDIRFHLGGLK